MSTMSTPGDGQTSASRLILATALRYQTLRDGLMNLMMADAQAVVRTDRDRQQSSAKAPWVAVNDLRTDHGDRVGIDLLHDANEAPRVGDRNVGRHLESLTRSQFFMSIDQIRKGVKIGGKMTQQRRGYALRDHGLQTLKTYWPRFMNEQGLYHLAGMRGQYYDPDDMILGLEGYTDAEQDQTLEDILINPLLAPTHSRAYYGGAATAINKVGETNITTSDMFSFETLDKVITSMEERSSPLQGIDLSSEDTKQLGDPFYLCLVSPTQYNDLITSTTGRQLQNLAAAALERKKLYADSNLFTGECFWYRGVLIRKMHIPIRTYAGSNIKVSLDNNDATTEAQAVPAGVTVDRALLLGGQAGAVALGRNTNGTNFALETESLDFKNGEGMVISWIGGVSKIRIRQKSGKLIDTGVATIDTAVTPA